MTSIGTTLPVATSDSTVITSFDIFPATMRALLDAVKGAENETETIAGRKSPRPCLVAVRGRAGRDVLRSSPDRDRGVPRLAGCDPAPRHRGSRAWSLARRQARSEEHTSALHSREKLVCRHLL